MTSLLRIELRKLLPYRTFWAILAVFVILLFVILYGSSNVTINGQSAGATFYKFPDIWPKLTYIASYFNLLLGILLIITITDEYSFRTIRQQVIDGYTRADVVQAKYSVVLLLGVACALYVFLLGLLFGIGFADEVATDKILTDAQFVFYYLVQAIGYMSLAMLFGFLVKKSGLAIMAFLLYAKVVEPIIHYKLPDSLDKYFPMKVLSSLTPMPGKEMFEMVTGASEALTPLEALLPAVLYISLFCVLSYRLLKSRDL
ncbi:ABC transporter permease subunit [Rufibacter ruber]|uniref:ABC transporter permease subunit n=1 Tax=Rufibacter ruber TaxID=1783499 RepID=UPI000831F39E|nr:ABC transporter permease subunit [Rufibacter ruber]